MRLFLYTFDLGNRLKHMTFRFVNRNRQVVGSTPTLGSRFNRLQFAYLFTCRKLRSPKKHQASRLRHGIQVPSWVRSAYDTKTFSWIASFASLLPVEVRSCKPKPMPIFLRKAVGGSPPAKTQT